jgi:hypothetical protein
MPPSVYTDPHALSTTAYADPTKLAARVNEIIARDGAFRFRTHVGFLECR